MPAPRQLSTGKLAFLVALVLFGLAGSFIHFVHPGGFEGQLVWGLALLPGIVPAQLLGVIADKLIPRLSTIFFWAAFALFNVLWYWLVGYAIVKFARRAKPWDGF